jgi:hypothetical protein
MAPILEQSENLPPARKQLQSGFMPLRKLVFIFFMGNRGFQLQSFVKNGIGLTLKR